MTATPQQTRPEGISRRSLLNRSAAGLGIALTGSLGSVFGSGPTQAMARHGAVGYGPLVADPAGLLSLPEGFSYKLVARSGVTLLDSGQAAPSDPDGMASFVRRGGNGSVLVLNHEVSGGEATRCRAIPGFVYDATAGGGTTTIEVDRNGNRLRHYVSLAGTHNNCAGGRTPWDTWLTCEESEAILGKRHGYVFEVDPYDQDANRDPKPIKALGRYAHESVVVDPRYRRDLRDRGREQPERAAVPVDPAEVRAPAAQGLAPQARRRRGRRCEAMKAFTRRGAFVPDLSVATAARHDLPRRVGRPCPTATPPRRPPASSSARGEITRSRKLEGMWWGDGGAYFVASFARFTDGSAAQHDGQVWFLDPRHDTIELKLHFVYTPGDQDGDPDGPDNITVSPYGGVLLAEDGEGAQHLVGVTDSGEVFNFARNDDPEGSEFAGPTFSHDRKTLFANVQTPGYVYAIQGPFRKQH